MAPKINSRQKGASFERWVANWFKTNWGCETRRGQQFAGGPESPDVVGLAGIHIEVKAVEKLQMQKAMDQSVRDAGDKIPIVISKKNRKEPMVTVRLRDLDDFIRLMDLNKRVADA